MARRVAINEVRQLHADGAYEARVAEERRRGVRLERPTRQIVTPVDEAPLGLAERKRVGRPSGTGEQPVALGGESDDAALPSWRAPKKQERLDAVGRCHVESTVDAPAQESGCGRVRRAAELVSPHVGGVLPLRQSGEAPDVRRPVRLRGASRGGGSETMSLRW